MTLAEFLAARLDEDQMWAQAAGDTDKGRSWTAAEGGYPVSGPLVDDGWGVTVVPPAPTRAQTAHIARHDPARVLREVAAKRSILERHRDCGSGIGYCDDGGHGSDGEDPGCAEMEDLAAPWSGHPDYDQSWSPAPVAEPVPGEVST